jgi:TetR/AcrR family transcriptional regulator, lmrAB and yxaGH operons repressor
MPQRSDAKDRMVLAARQLFRERGYHATAFSDVLQLSAAPRGSVYFHFPGGKRQLAAGVAEAHAREQVDVIARLAARSTSAAELVAVYVELARDLLVERGYQQGCAIAPIVLEAARESDELAEVAQRSFVAIIESMTVHLRAFGLESDAALRLADATVSGVEGALITARALRSTRPFESLLPVLVNQANQDVSPSAEPNSGGSENHQ